MVWWQMALDLGSLTSYTLAYNHYSTMDAFSHVLELWPVPLTASYYSLGLPSSPSRLCLRSPVSGTCALTVSVVISFLTGRGIAFGAPG